MSRPGYDSYRPADRSSPSSKHQSDHRGRNRETDVDERRALRRKKTDDLHPRSNSYNKSYGSPIRGRAPNSALKGLKSRSPSLHQGNDKIIENQFTANGAITSPNDLRSPQEKSFYDRFCPLKEN
ncbi:MAG: hypothetical protein Q9173_001813 [Seirophora scorigena]